MQNREQDTVPISKGFEPRVGCVQVTANFEWRGTWGPVWQHDSEKQMRAGVIQDGERTGHSMDWACGRYQAPSGQLMPPLRQDRGQSRLGEVDELVGSLWKSPDGQGGACIALLSGEGPGKERWIWEPGASIRRGGRHLSGEATRDTEVGNWINSGVGVFSWPAQYLFFKSTKSQHGGKPSRVWALTSQASLHMQLSPTPKCQAPAYRIINPQVLPPLCCPGPPGVTSLHAQLRIFDQGL